MEIVSANQLEDWVTHGEVLEKDSRGVKVVRLADGRLLKIFRSRRHPLLVRLRPDARLFSRNAQRLQTLGIRIPQILDSFWIDRSQGVSACLYQPLEGQPLDKLFRDARPEFGPLLPGLAAYIRNLHRKGIYFRSLHLGNILRTPDGDFGLIDFLDLRFKRHPLGPMLVRRNFRHLQDYLARRKVEQFPWDELMAAYAQACRQHD